MQLSDVNAALDGDSLKLSCVVSLIDWYYFTVSFLRRWKKLLFMTHELWKWHRYSWRVGDGEIRRSRWIVERACRVYELQWVFAWQERPYIHDSTASRPICEVKHVLAELVLRWGTTLESLVMFFCLFSTQLPTFLFLGFQDSFSYTIPDYPYSVCNKNPTRERWS